MKRLIILIFIVGIQCSQYSTKRCDCNQMITENDCSTQSEICVWDQIKKKCQDRYQEVTGYIKPTFCSSTNQQDCVNLFSTKYVCQWINNKCTHFTGCEAFDKTTDKDCQEISNLCITNGSFCIELDLCENYQTKSSCIKSIKEKYCYWNDEQKTCSDITECNQLPKSLHSDYECRKQIKTCTVKQEGGCEESGDSCSDQKLEIQCQYDKNKTQQCVWLNKSCQQKTCEIAPTNYTTETQCISFLSSCTLKQQGGCRNRTQCNDVINETACTVDFQNNRCYWDGLTCFEKKCENATKQFTSDDQCKKLASNCTLKKNGGCKIFQYCNQIEVMSACTKDLSGNNCVFDSLCRSEDCGDAPTSYTTTEQCKQFDPTSICLSKANGGCYKAQSCSDLQTQQDCKVDQKGTSCFWNSDAKKCYAIDPITCESFVQKQQCTQFSELNCMWQDGCQLKECVFASKTINTFQGCQGYKETCTLTADGLGCIEIPLICEANLSEKSCIVRGNYIDGKFKTFNCSWSRIGCKDSNIKTCDMAADTITSNAGCQSFSELCILSNTGKGCIDNPENCSDKIEVNCITIYSLQKYECKWDTEKQLCYEYNCTEASKNINSFSYTTCQNFLGRCIPNNDLTNCIERPISCSDLGVRNCEIDDSSNKCFLKGNQCVEAKCENVQINTQGKCYQSRVQQNSSCVINNERTGCWKLQQKCSDYKIKENCEFQSNNSYCKWNSSLNICETNCDKAQDFTKTFDDCQKYGEYCQPLQRTESQGCTNLKENCGEYTVQAQCHKTISQNSKEYDVCEWIDIYKECNKIEPKFIVDVIKDESDCQARFSSIYTIKYGQFLSCQLRYMRCEYYETKDKCTLADEGPCIYDKTCKLLIQTVNLDCSKFKGSYKICETFSPKCKGSLNQSQLQCMNKECNDFYSKGLWSECQMYLDCSVTNDFYCTIKQASCDQYKSLKDCVQISQSSFCQWNGNVCSSWNNQCETIKITTVPDICSYYSNNCTHNKSKTSCQLKQDNCSSYSQDSCSESKQGVCIWKQSTNQCIYPQSDQDCQFKQGTSLSVQDCSQINSNCYPNRAKTTCQTLKSSCSQYTNLEECTINQVQQKCIQTQAQNSGASCTEYLDSQDCDTVFLGENVTTAEACRLYGCSWKDSSSCAKKSCENTPQELISLNQCHVWINDCVLNSLKTGCIKQKDKCSDYLNENDCSFAKEGGCMIKKSKCVLKTCYQADPSIYSTHNNCQLYSPMCTVTRPGGCEQMGPCSTELLEIPCKQNLKYQCHWNVIEETCVNDVCSELEQNSSFDTSQECQSKGCILKDTGLGCQDRGECQDYNELQCKDGLNKNNQECEWNKNLETPICEIKSCSTAPSSMKSHTECHTYLNGCTVQAKVMDGGSYQAGGCTTTQNCTNYVIEDQCKLDLANNICGWDGQKCDIKSCSTAPQTTFYSTHENCQNYLKNCTVNSKLQGCIEIPITCEEITIEAQCQIKRSGDKCIWLGSVGCKLRTCDIATSENLPSLSFDNEDDCKNFLPTCSFSSTKCIYKACEFYRFTTHQQCSDAMSGCTTDGVKCVKKHISCDNALSAGGCTTNDKGEACQWVEWYNPPHCVLKKCDTASLSLKTEVECQNYYSKDCTTKLNGGCQLKKQCSDAKIQGACTTNLQGEKCYWDNSQCRDKQCSDLYGAVHQECYKQLQGCTVGENGKCTEMRYCQEMKFQKQCIEGLDGPCLWISLYTNDDLSKGACFQYSSCKSLKWDSVEKCQMISPYCTSDGNQCQSITRCGNSKGFCNIGTDGNCIKVLVNENPVCKKLESCTEAKYYSYDECQMASKKCTVDPDLGCIDLQVCSNYQKEKSCKINAVGPIIIMNIIKSTGLCIWDSLTKKCRDKSCEDFTLTNHEECQAALDKCTFDGKKCIEQLNCSGYATQEQCSAIKGLDGKCFWEEDQCLAITSCDAASKNQQACQVVKDRCNWIPATDKTASSCNEHTCETYFKTNGNCSKFFNFNFSQQQFCDKNQQGDCIEIDPIYYSQDKCLTNTNFTFRWDTTCQVCQKEIEIPAQIPIVDPLYQNPIEVVYSYIIFYSFIVFNLQNI